MMKIAIGTSAYTLTIEMPDGQQVYDLSVLNKNQLEGVREMVVNWWAVQCGFAAPYGER